MIWGKDLEREIWAGVGWLKSLAWTLVWTAGFAVAFYIAGAWFALGVKSVGGLVSVNVTAPAVTIDKGVPDAKAEHD